MFAPFWKPDEPSAPIPEPLCRELTALKAGAIQRCSLIALANRTAPCLVAAYDCGEHLCDTLLAVWHGTAREPYRLEAQQVTVELSPDHRFLLVGELEYADDPELQMPAPARGRTDRIDLTTGRRSHFADCLSPVLSPKGRYYVCRDLAGNVLRVPVSGGPLETIVNVQIPENDAIKLGGAFNDYPEPVEFPTPSTLKYSLYLQSETVLELEAPFSE